ncbi:modification methylase [Arcobacter sp. CECT 8986]|uniref:DNA adenine methylase n=1 Tax=Arcobacter sp. CECT 8986 TaxID=2044507 RepID=UPI001009EF01|nr:DNA adenine methylase [Arcobacter sp. CECT 8986]RXJ98098.1 modification methylase [Arcobacter sp. CECT 8986]
MNYIGSKLKLSSWIEDEIASYVGENNLQKMIFCDLFAGTGIVGRTFKNKVAKVISNDIEEYSYILNRNYIENTGFISNKERYINELNNLPLVDDGFIYQNYCMGSGSERQYFSDYNGKKIDTIRQKIEEWKTENSITDDLYYFLLASLLESADKVANTASVYGAFLKHIKKSASKDLVLENAEFEVTNNINNVYNCDANELINEIEGDILYLDPPYNQRQYGANYHLLNTIAKYDDFTPRGKTGMRDYKRSLYCSKREVCNIFDNLVKNANFRYIFLSYNNEGLMSLDDIKNIAESNRYKYSFHEKNYQRFKADKTENRNHKADNTFEYLHILEKQ